MFDSIRVNVEQYKELIEKFKGIESFEIFLNPDGKANWDEIAKAIGTTDERAISYFKTMDDGNGTIDNTSASVDGMSDYLKKSGQSFDFAAVKATLLNTALNAGIFLVASLAIQGIATAIDNYVHRAEKAIELTEELKSKHEDLSSEYESHKKLVDECAESYERLSKGVDTATNKNQSLSTEDYEEYLRITNELSDAFPSLYQTLDDNGNAILTLGQNGKSATEDLKALLEAEENLNNYKVAQDIDGLFGGVKVKIEEANAAIEEYQSSSAELEESYNTLKNIASNGSLLPSDGVTFSVDTNKEGGIEYYSALIKTVQNFYAELDPIRRNELLSFDPTNVPVDKGNGLFDFFLDTASLTEDEIEKLSAEIKTQTENILPVLQDAVSDGLNGKNLKQQEADLAWKDFLPQLVAATKSQGSFKGLAVDENGDSIAFGEDLQNLALDIVSKLDSGFAEKMGDDPYGWVRDNIILSLTNLDEGERKEIIDSYNKLLELNPGDLSVDNQTLIDSYVETIADAFDKEESEIKLLFGFDVDETYRTKYNDAIERFGFDSSAVLEQFFTDKGIDTEKEIDYFNKVTKGAETAEEAIEMYRKAMVSLHDTEPPSFASALSSVQKLSVGLDQLDSIMADVINGENFDWSSILNNDDLKKAFEGCGEAYDDFIKAISESPDDLSKFKMENCT